jgi:hypothetical protein
MSRDGERLIELVNEYGSRVGHVLSDMVPPAAQVHLLNAQRELITALMLIYENRMTTGTGARSGRGAAGTRRSPAKKRTARRVGKIPID